MFNGRRRPRPASLAATADCASASWWWCVPSLCLFAGASLVRAAPQDTGEATAPKTAIVAAGSHYAAGPVRRFLFGEGYRNLWVTPFAVEVLDLGSFDGGLRPRRKGGGKQTQSLTFEGREGREWKFRSIDKDPSAVLPEALRGTFIDALVQDQVSSAHPLGPLIVDPLAAAVGILSASHRPVLLPDDERLGAFRKEFAGRLGFIEEKVRSEPPITPGFEGFHRLLDTAELWQRLDEHPEEKVDAQALLRARLFDVFINDFDRHKDQWRWARKEGTQLWQPVPEDRDQAFVRYSGLVLSLVRPSQPRLVNFGPNYPGIFGLTWQGRFVDRRHLAELEWPRWREAIQHIQAAITEASIDEASNRLPAEYRRVTGERTASALKARLRQLPKAARRFYELLAKDVEIHGSDERERVTVSSVADGLIQVRVTGKGGAARFLRRFDPGETKSVRLYLKGGDDVVVREAGTAGLTLRVIAGKGEDVLDDSRGGRTRFYDEGAKSRVLPGVGTKEDSRPYTQPLDSSGNPERDWGGQSSFMPWVSAGGDLGLFLGGNLTFTNYAFRHHPYAQKHELGAGFATGVTTFRVDYKGEFVPVNRTARFRIRARASALDVIRFYCLGNETKSEGPEEFFEVLQKQFSISPQYEFRFRRMDLSLGALAQYTKEASRTSFASTTRPYGYGGFFKAGPRLDVEIARRDRAIEGTSGGRLQIGGSFFPKAWSVKRTFGEIHGEAFGFLRARVPLRPTLHLHAGGKRVFGRYPFQEAAFLGGSDTVRGLRPQRYAGDASVFGSAELRLRLGRVRLFLPSDIGIFGLADAGRVFKEGEVSDRWHTGAGGGLWVALLKPENTVTLAMARSEGVNRLYLRAGFGF